MKRTIAVFLVLITAFSLAACRETADISAPDGETVELPDNFTAPNLNGFLDHIDKCVSNYDESNAFCKWVYTKQKLPVLKAAEGYTVGEYKTFSGVTGYSAFVYDSAGNMTAELAVADLHNANSSVYDNTLFFIDNYDPTMFSGRESIQGECKFGDYVMFDRRQSEDESSEIAPPVVFFEYGGSLIRVFDHRSDPAQWDIRFLDCFDLGICHNRAAYFHEEPVDESFSSRELEDFIDFVDKKGLTLCPYSFYSGQYWSDCGDNFAFLEWLGAKTQIPIPIISDGFKVTYCGIHRNQYYFYVSKGEKVEAVIVVEEISDELKNKSLVDLVSNYMQVRDKSYYDVDNAHISGECKFGEYILYDRHTWEYEYQDEKVESVAPPILFFRYDGYLIAVADRRTDETDQWDAHFLDCFDLEMHGV